MSPSLPDRPNLDHLKKQAKDRLRALQATSPDAQLADAQHALARDYGFASWPKLKAHVEALEQSAPAPPPPAAPTATGSFQRYTNRARQALFFSRWEAAQQGSPAIEPEHLLLGLINARQGLSPAFGPVAELRADVTRRVTVADALPNTVIIPFNDGVKLAIEAAVDEADRLQQERVTTAHVLAGLLREPSLATEVLRDRGVDLSQALAELRRAPGED